MKYIVWFDWHFNKYIRAVWAEKLLTDFLEKPAPGTAILQNIINVVLRTEEQRVIKNFRLQAVCCRVYEIQSLRKQVLLGHNQ